uniref:Uncharacterized protein n=1 Tax=Oryza punctata TaxID=4537 RepID=A0A0E0KWG7_ORYPU
MPLVARLASVVRIPRRLRAFDPLLRDFGAQNFNGAKPDLIAPRVGARKPPFSSVVCAEAERIHVHSTPDGSSSPGQGSKGEVNVEMHYTYPVSVQEKPLGVRWERVVCAVASHLHAQVAIPYESEFNDELMILSYRPSSHLFVRGACNWVLDFLKTRGNEDEQADNICGEASWRGSPGSWNLNRS